MDSTQAEDSGTSRGVYRSPIGVIEIQATDRGISALGFSGEAGENADAQNWRPAYVDLTATEAEEIASSNAFAHLKRCLHQLDEYFAARRTEFTVPLDMRGTDFYELVWRALLDIPCGETASYGEIAEKIGNPGASRAVGQANNKNPIGLLVPCHRVVGAGGELTGYASGTWRKKWLLEHEKRMTAQKSAAG